MKTYAKVTFICVVPEDVELHVLGEKWSDDSATPLGKPVSKREVRAYIEKALSSWGGQRHPLEPLYGGLKPQLMTIEYSALRKALLGPGPVRK